YHRWQRRLIDRQRLAVLQEDLMIEIEVLAPGQGAEWHQTLNVRREWRVAPAGLVRAAEYRCRNDLARLRGNALERNSFGSAVGGDILQLDTCLLLLGFPRTLGYLTIGRRGQMQHGLRRLLGCMNLR